MSDDSPGFFRSLSGLATEWVNTKRRSLATEPQTQVDSQSTGTTYNFSGQELTFEQLRDIKEMREGGGQVAALMHSKALLNFGEGAEVHVGGEDDEPTEVVDGEELTLTEWIDDHFPHLDMQVLDLGEDALWYPYAVGEHLETRAGGYKKFLPAEPWTLMPETNANGEIVQWHQRVKTNGGYSEQRLAPEEIINIVLNKRSARDEVGISEVLRNQEEIQAFKENEQAINNAIELHGFPQRHVKVGKEDGAPLRDNDLRRVRNIFDPRTSDANTAYFTGQDVDVNTLEAEQFDYTAIHEMDMRNLTTALGLPLEAGNVGSDGLGSGKPAELRFALLKLNIKANQRSFGVQFTEKVLRPAIRDYSPFDHTADIQLEIDDPLEDIGEVADLIQKVGGYMETNEARSKLNLPEKEDLEDEYGKPGDAEDEGLGGGPGLFREARSLQSVPDNAVSISDRSEAPEGASVITGPGGGLYYVPDGGDSDTDGDGVQSPQETQEEVSRIVESGSHEELENHVAEKTGVDDVSLPAGLSDEEATRMGSTLSRAGEAGLTDEVAEINLDTSGDQLGVYTFNDSSLSFDMDVSEDDLDGAVENGEAVGEDLEWLVLHELGHAEHNGTLEDIDEVGEVFDAGLAVTRDGEFVGRDRVDMVDEEVSAYARSNPGEFVAEVFSGLSMGQEFSDDVMEVYEEWDGPDSWQQYRGDA